MSSRMKKNINMSYFFKIVPSSLIQPKFVPYLDHMQGYLEKNISLDPVKEYLLEDHFVFLPMVNILEEDERYISN